MVRQAHTYLVGAMSGATLIVIAIAVFVLLVSAQVFRDWPIAALGDGGGNSAGVSDARAASQATTAPGGGTVTSATAAATGAANGRSGGSGGGSAGKAAGTGSLDTTAVTPAGQGDAPQGEGGNAGGGPAASNPPSAPAPSTSPGDSGPSSGSGGGGSGGSGGSGSTATTTSGKVAETVNNTVGTVDETVTGGALEKTGVTGVTEGVVEAVVGPESTVGKVVDETVGAVGGILGGGK